MAKTLKHLLPYALFILTHFVFSFFVICHYQARFDFSPKLVGAHLLLVLLIHFGLLGAGVLLLRLFSFRKNKLLLVSLVFIYAIPFYMLTLIYLLSFVSQHLWGANVTASMAIGYMSDFQNFIESLPIKTSYLYGFVVGHFLLIFLGFFLFRKVIFRGLNAISEWFFKSGPLSFQKNIGKIIFAGFIATIGFGLWKSHDIKRYIHQSGDPVLDTIFGPFKEFHNFDDPKSVTIALREKQLEEAYPVIENFDRKNVIFIIADALRSDYLPTYGYPDTLTPFISRMMEEGEMKQVKSMVSTCSDSHCGIISSLASKEWGSLGFDNFFIHDLLKKQGYQVNFILSGSHLDWYNLYKSYGKHIDFYFDGYLTKSFGINDDQLLFEGLDSVGVYKGIPSFFYFHFMAPHIAGRKLEQYERFTPTKSTLDDKLFKSGHYDSRILINNYKNGIIQFDSMLKQLFEDLEQKGYLQNSLIFIFGDHGEAFGEHDHFGHVFELYQEDISIPLIIYDSDASANYKNLSSASQLDIATTAIDRLGLPIPESWEGRSLLLPDTSRITYHQTTMPKKKTLAFIEKTDSTWTKCIFKEKQGHFFVFDLLKDPKELINLWNDLPQGQKKLYEERLKEKFNLD